MNQALVGGEHAMIQMDGKPVGYLRWQGELMALDVMIRQAETGDLARMEMVRAAAFAPIFAGFREALGDEIYELAQAPGDRQQGAYLASLLAEGSGWEVYVAEVAGGVVGFVSVRLDEAMRVGEIGLNAVHPDHAGRGIGSRLYEVALGRMRDAGMQVATVSTGGDAGHAPARRAYEKVGFDVRIPSVWMCRKL